MGSRWLLFTNIIYTYWSLHLPSKIAICKHWSKITTACISACVLRSINTKIMLTNCFWLFLNKLRRKLNQSISYQQHFQTNREYIPCPKCKKAPTNVEAYLLFTKNNGTRGQTWTGTLLPARDFKSLVSTDSTTRANSEYRKHCYWYC